MAHLAGVRAGIGRHRRMPIGAGGADERRVIFRLAIIERHAPTLAVTRRGFDAGVEGDVVAQAESVGEALHVIVDLPVRRIIGIGIRHREVGVMRLGFRRDEMCRIINR